MDRDTAIELARSYLADQIEIKAISEKESKGLPLYSDGDRHDYYFFCFHGPKEALGVGGSHCAAVSKENGGRCGIRTHDLWLRRPTLYPTELIALV